jgi:hypothetical protein
MGRKLREIEYASEADVNQRLSSGRTVRKAKQ